MKRALATVAVLAVAALGGCGVDTCTSSAARISPDVRTSCTLAAGSSATIRVPLCSGCNDSSPTCQAEFVNGSFEISPNVQQCQEQLGCASAGCNAAVSNVTCGVTVPAGLSGQYDMVLVGDGGQTIYGTVTIGSGAGSTCVL